MSDIYTPDEAARTPRPRLHGGRVLATARALATAQKRIEELERRLKQAGETNIFNNDIIEASTVELHNFGHSVDAGLFEAISAVCVQLATANRLITQHPEQLRRVAEAVARRVSQSCTALGRVDVEHRADLEAIIAEATKTNGQ